MPKTIAICNQKGGVGKTTTALNIAASLALDGSHVLLIDLGPQANATSGLGVNKKQLNCSIYQVLLNDISIDKAIIPTAIKNLWLVPSEVALSGAEIELVGIAKRESKLRDAINPARESYDLILIDCPPSLGLLTLNGMVAADAVLIPMQCEYFAMEGLSQLLDSVRLVQGNLNSKLSLEGILLTMADFRTKLTNDVIQEVRQFFGSKVYDVVIPRSVRLSEAPSHGLPIALYDPSSTGAQAYQLLAQKIKENLYARDTRIGERNPGADSGGNAGPEGSGGHQGSPSVNKAGPIPASSEPR